MPEGVEALDDEDGGDHGAGDTADDAHRCGSSSRGRVWVHRSWSGWDRDTRSVPAPTVAPMCGRYAATKNQGDLVEEFEVEVDATGEPTRAVMTHQQNPPAGQPDYNVAPTKKAPVVMSRPLRGSDDDAPPVRQLRLVNWGLVPSWAKDVKIGNRMINSRADSVLEKPAFKRAAKSRRCLVPAEVVRMAEVADRDGHQGQAAQAALLHAPRRRRRHGLRRAVRVLARQGRRGPRRPRRVADVVHHHHDRRRARPRPHPRPSALVLERSDWAAWLDPQTDEETVRRLLAFEQPGRFDAYPISTEVNNTRNNGPELLLPLAADELHGVVDIVTGEVIGPMTAGMRVDPVIVEVPTPGGPARVHVRRPRGARGRCCWVTAPAAG